MIALIALTAGAAAIIGYANSVSPSPSPRVGAVAAVTAAVAAVAVGWLAFIAGAISSPVALIAGGGAVIAAVVAVGAAEATDRAYRCHRRRPNG